VQFAEQEDCDVLIVAMKSSAVWEEGPCLDPAFLLQKAPCRVCLVAPPPIPQTVSES
jgi:hypothetical protein